MVTVTQLAKAACPQNHYIEYYISCLGVHTIESISDPVSVAIEDSAGLSDSLSVCITRHLLGHNMETELAALFSCAWLPSLLYTCSGLSPLAQEGA